jgi:peptidyl-prolyl cis-trans isomerase C
MVKSSLKGLVLGGLLVASSSLALASADPKTVVAKVNEEPITNADVSDVQKALPPQIVQQAKDKKKLFEGLRDQLVIVRLLVQEANKAGIEKDPDVQKQLTRLKEGLLFQAYLSKQIAPQITEASLKAAYDKYVKDFPKDLKETRARHILVKDESTAKSLIKQLQGGADFLKLARENSLDPGSKNDGGDLGFFTAETMLPAFSEAADKLKPGEFSKEPVKTEFGFHIIRVEDRRTQRPKSFDEMKPELAAKLQDEAAKALIEKLKASAKIALFDEQGKPDTAAPAPAAPAAETPAPAAAAPAAPAPAAAAPAAPAAQ